MTDSLVADVWLGGLLGKPAFHLGYSAKPDVVVVGPAFVDAKVATTGLDRAQSLIAVGYRLVDTNVRLDRPAGDIERAPVSAVVRAAAPGDAEGVRAVASGAFRFDRFHADPAIPDAVADRVKGEWAGNFFKGLRGDRMIVAVAESDILGFLQILDRADHSVIDLIAVAPGAQGNGVATAMIAHAIGQGPARPWRVGTQVANAASIRLYERLGFRCGESQYVFHRHVN